MDVIDLIEVPSFDERRRRFRRGLFTFTGVLAAVVLAEKYNGAVSRALKSAKRGISAAITSWIEDQSGTKLFTIEGDEPPSLTTSALELSTLMALSQQEQHSLLTAAQRQLHERASMSTDARQRVSLDTHAAPVLVTTLAGEGGQYPSFSGQDGHRVGRSEEGFQEEDPSMPQFFQSTKFFAVLDVDEARVLFNETPKVRLAPHEVLFCAGEPSDSGIFIVVSGQLGVFLDCNTSPQGSAPIHANTLRYGESVGDLDVVDGAERSVTCIALDEGCLLVQVPRALFLSFVHSHPRALLLYLQQGLARLWRVAHFTLSDFLQVPHMHQRRPPSQPRQPPTLRLGPQGELVEDNLAAQAAGARLPSQSCSIATQTSTSDLQATSEAELATDSARSMSGSQVIEAGIGLSQRGKAALDVRGQGEKDDLEEEEEEEEETDADESGEQQQHNSTMARLSSCPVPIVLPPSPGFRECSRLSQNGGSLISPGSSSTSSALLPGLGCFTGGPQPCRRSSSISGPTALPPAPNARRGGHGGGGGAADGSASGTCWPRGAGGKQQQQQQQQQGRDSHLFAVQEERQQEAGLGAPELGMQGSGGAGAQRAHTGGAQGSGGDSCSGRVQAGYVQQGIGSGGLQGEGHRTGEQGHSTGRGQGSWGAHGNKRGGRRVAAKQGMPEKEPVLAGPSCRVQTSPALRRTFEFGTHACLAEGWDVVGAEELGLDGGVWARLAHRRQLYGQPFPLPRGGVLQEVDWACGQFYLLVDGHLLAERKVTVPGSEAPRATGDASADQVDLQERAIVVPGSMISCAAFLSSTAARCRMVALEPARLVAFGWQHLEALVCDNELEPEAVVLPLLLAAARAMGPLIRRFIGLGLNRVWLNSGDVAYRQGDDASCLYVVISGRLRLLHESVHPVTSRTVVHVEEEVARGEAVGAVWAITGGQHDTTALCVRDSELVRMSKSAFKIISQDSPLALTKLFSNMARRLMAAWEARMRGSKSSGIPRLMPPASGQPSGAGASADGSMPSAWQNSLSQHADIVTIAIVPAGVMPAQPPPSLQRPGHVTPSVPQPPGVASLMAVKRLSSALKEALAPNGSVLCLNSTSIGLLFPTASERLDVLFYRSKITSWLSSQEEEYRFIILEGDYHPTPWSSLCVAQADCILLVAAEGATPALGECERMLVFGSSSGSAAAGPQLHRQHSLRQQQQLQQQQMHRSRSAVRRQDSNISSSSTNLPAGYHSGLTTPGRQSADAGIMSANPANDAVQTPPAPAPHQRPAENSSRLSMEGRPDAHAPPPQPPAPLTAGQGSCPGAAGGAGTEQQQQQQQQQQRLQAGGAYGHGAGEIPGGHQEPIPTMQELLHGAQPGGISSAGSDPQAMSQRGGIGSYLHSLLYHSGGSTTSVDNPYPQRQQQQQQNSAPAPNAPSTNPIILEANAAARAEAVAAAAASASPAGVASCEQGPTGSSQEQLPGPMGALPLLQQQQHQQQRAPASGSSSNVWSSSGRMPPTPQLPSTAGSMSGGADVLSSLRRVELVILHPMPPSAPAGGVRGSAGVSRRGIAGAAAVEFVADRFKAGRASRGAGAAAAAAAAGAPSASAASSRWLPSGTKEWLSRRPHLTRHHHVRLARDADVERLARWMAGKAVGLVLSGGGSRGLAHLGVLCALEDAGVPVDVVGGTSQGAFMAGLYAQGLSRDQLQVAVQYYARRMGSMRHLLSDLTLPMLSVFTGAGFDAALRDAFGTGASSIEDLWLSFFCVSTNLSRGEPSIHTEGSLWKLVRASMTIVGLLPPVYENGDLLVDGGYMNNIPVDVMRSMGVETVIVVDVEGKDDMCWRNLAPYDGGVSGWRLLWDRWCPVPSWRYGMKLPRYAHIINQLTWMTHAHNLRRVSEDYCIDLYLRPPNIGSFKLMDYHLMERIVKDAYRYTSLTVSRWSQLQGLSSHVLRANRLASAAAGNPVERDVWSPPLIPPNLTSQGGPAGARAAMGPGSVAATSARSVPSPSSGGGGSSRAPHGGRGSGTGGSDRPPAAGAGGTQAYSGPGDSSPGAPAAGIGMGTGMPAGAGFMPAASMGLPAASMHGSPGAPGRGASRGGVGQPLFLPSGHHGGLGMGTGNGGGHNGGTGQHPASSIMCMTQLQKKQAAEAGNNTAGAAAATLPGGTTAQPPPVGGRAHRMSLLSRGSPVGGAGGGAGGAAGSRAGGHGRAPPSASAATAPPPAASAMAAEAIQSARKSLHGRGASCNGSGGSGSGGVMFGGGAAPGHGAGLQPQGEGGGYGGWPQWGQWGRATLGQIRKTIDENAGIAAAAFGGGSARREAQQQQQQQQREGTEQATLQQMPREQEQEVKPVDPQGSTIMDSEQQQQQQQQQEQPEIMQGLSKSRTSHTLLGLLQDGQGQ